ncbi:hypothetical protein GTQ34_14360 [Muricauda sp. JGD-17]|uniref:Peptidase S9 prolyl oligopeptidase catalytic domain-containing protein n=1 Tax=Flagellimonas ochracea TaxID=2696472 RepID=A0A964WYR8_9FLAO|nr:hypothetical protein [Allomuricauda ochracea]NAY93098.1 hypothetical protein [Allomuricauda ochracea]
MHFIGNEVFVFNSKPVSFSPPFFSAAISPIAGCAKETDLRNAWQIRNISVWVIHGAKDKTININCSYEAVKHIKSNGGSPKFTVYQDVGHDLEEIWGNTLYNDEWYTWMLNQNRKNNLPKYIQPKKSILKEYYGQYSMDGNTLSITMENEHLQVSLGKGRTRKMQAESNTVFSFEKSSFIGLRFIKTVDSVTGFEMLPQTEKKASKIN